MSHHTLHKIFNTCLFILLFPLGYFGYLYASVSMSNSQDPVMYASQLNLSDGWQAAAPIPGLDNPFGGIQMIFSSGGATAWAVGSNTDGQRYMAITTGGNWQSIPITSGFGGQLNGFMAAYPETGAKTNAWIFNGNSVVYFDGKNFETPDTTTFSNYNNISFISSSGTGWVIAPSKAQNNQLYVSAFNTLSATVNKWSPPVVLPLTAIFKNNYGYNNYKAVSNKLYILGMQNSNTALISVDQANNIKVLNNNFNLSKAPNTGFVAVQGNHIVVLFFVTQSSSNIPYSYYSGDGGKTWANISSQMPSSFPQMDVNNIVSVNGMVAIPLGGQTGRFMNLNQANPAWLAYPAAPISDEEISITLSADGTQQCPWDETHVSCFNFTTQKWITTALPSGETIPFGSINPVALGNNKIAAMDQNNNGLFYDGSDWHVQSVAPINYEPLLSTAVMPNAFGPNSVWVFGFFNPDTK